MRQEGITFIEIGKNLGLSASLVSKLYRRYAVLNDLFDQEAFCLGNRICLSQPIQHLHHMNGRYFQEA